MARKWKELRHFFLSAAVVKEKVVRIADTMHRHVGRNELFDFRSRKEASIRRNRKRSIRYIIWNRMKNPETKRILDT